MTPIDALIEMLGRLNACGGGPVHSTDEELNQWPTAAVAAFKKQKLMLKAPPASSVTCPGCEFDCVMPVHTPQVSTGKREPFIVCDKRSDINRVTVSADRLTQWRCNADLVCDFVADSLGLRRSSRQAGADRLWKIGVAKGDKRSQMLCLKVDGELSLIAGEASYPLADLVLYSDGNFRINYKIIRRLVDSSATTDPRDTPSTVRRESRKLETKAMHEIWQKECRRLRKKYPGKSDAWIPTKISKMDIALGRNAETIRKNMKK